MPKLIATVSTVVIREGKRITVGPGSTNTGAFAFTDDEVKQINAIHPTALRKPVNESPAAVTTDDDDAAPAKPKSAKARKAAAEKDSTKAGAVENKSGEPADTTDADADEDEAGDEDDDI